MTDMGHHSDPPEPRVVVDLDCRRIDLPDGTFMLSPEVGARASTYLPMLSPREAEWLVLLACGPGAIDPPASVDVYDLCERLSTMPAPWVTVDDNHRPVRMVVVADVGGPVELAGRTYRAVPVDGDVL